MKNVNGLLAMKEGRPVTKGLLRRNLEMFKYLLSAGLWEYNCGQVRALHSGLPPSPARAWAQLGRSAQRLLATKAEQREPTRGGQVSHIHPVTHPSLSQESSPHPPLHHSAAPQESVGCHYQRTSSLETRGGPDMKWHLSREGAVMTST